MKTRTLRIRKSVLLCGIALLALASAANAGQGIHDVPGTCQGANCQSMLLMGSYSLSPDGYADCFQVQLLTDGNECVRIQVFQQDTDLEMVLACPDGTVWRDDDSGVGTKPLIKAQTRSPGWCTLQVCHWTGSGTSGSFRLRHGRYDYGNPNCNNPTEPLTSIAGFSSYAEKTESDPQ